MPALVLGPVGRQPVSKGHHLRGPLPVANQLQAQPAVAPRMLSSWDLAPASSRLPGAGMSPASRPAKVTAQPYVALASDSFFRHTLPS